KTLLEKTKDPNAEEAWEDFVSYYHEFMIMVLRKSTIPEKDQDDLVQQILLRLWKAMPDFEFDRNKGRFRTWLSFIIRNVIIDYVRKKKNDKISFVDMSVLPEKEQDFSEIDKKIEMEWQAHIGKLAMETIEKTFSDRAVKAFKMSLNGSPIEEIREFLQVKENSAYRMVKRVKNSFFKEIDTLRSNLEL
ncbi:MAG: sigma-70 family RNA polymerase sigma factor, partial [Planctomycetes bacterium]|nr:sigma-70 family RNA polymerase sigma factor [Planctomycetota bacterium]